MKTQEQDNQTPFEKFEALARKMMTTPKPEVDKKVTEEEAKKAEEETPKPSQ
jgi:hypothetical protein